MRLLLIFFLLQNFLGSTLYAQSKKKINEQLLTELVTQKHVYDSLLEVQNNFQTALKTAGKNVFNSYQKLNETKDQVLHKRFILAHNHDLLALLGYEANTIIPYTEIVQLDGPKSDYSLQIPSNKLFRTFPWSKTDSIAGLIDLKTREQNELLTSKIRTYDSINKSNINVLYSERKYMDSLVTLNTETEKEIDKYNAQIAYMVEKADALAIKWNEISNQKEEKEEEEYMKQVKAWEKKQKPGELHFVPPRVYKPRGEKPVLSTERKEEDYVNAMRENVPVEMQEPKIILQEQAAFPGGKSALSKYINEHLVLPNEVLEYGISDKSYVKFVISDQGKISNVKLQRGIPDCSECDAEAIRLVENMPDWIPAKRNGEAIITWYTLPVKFVEP